MRQGVEHGQPFHDNGIQPRHPDSKPADSVPAIRSTRLTSDQPSQITMLLNDVSAGVPDARSALLEKVYGQLRAIAQQRMARERPGHTLQATALVHEAYMKMLGDQPIMWQDRGHFYRAAAEAMRRILVDHARKHGAEKRGGDRQRVPLNVLDLASESDPQEILSLDRAIVRLQELDSGAAEVLRLRVFAGLSVEQAAGVLGISERTVKREWTYARAKLMHILETTADIDPS